MDAVRLQDLKPVTIGGENALSRAAVVALIGFAIAASYAAAHRGIWLDEVWSIYEGQHDISFRAALFDRWLSEISPPFFYFLSWLMEPVTGDSIFARRAFHLVPVLLAVAAFGLLYRRHVEGRSFLALFALLLVSHPTAIALFAEHRGFFIMSAAASVLAATLAIVAMQTRDYRRGDQHLLWLAFASATIIFSMHYIVAFEIGAIVACVLAALWLTGRRFWSIRLFAALVPAGIPAVVCFLLQRSMLVMFGQEGWIRTSFSMALVTIAGLLAITAMTLVIGLAAILLRKGELQRDRGSRSAAAMLGAATMLSLAALLAVNFIQPVVVDRYLAPYVPFLMVPVALLAARPIARERFLLAAAVVTAFVSIGFNARATANESRWDGAARIVAEEQGRCAGTVVHAAPHWLFLKKPMLVGSQEIEVLRIGTRIEARKFGLSVEDSSSRRVSAKCPTIIWVAHWFDYRPPLAAMADKSGLPLSRRQIEKGILRDDGQWLVAIFPAASAP